jgi:hypothetical protein
LESLAGSLASSLLCWKAMRVLSLLAVVVVSSCGFEPFEGETTALPVKVLQAPSACPATGCPRTSSAFVENDLPADGCSFPITIDQQQYAPSAPTAARVEAIAKVGRTDVTLNWRATGAMATVTCGWNSTMTLPEIEVLSIAPRPAP